MGSKNLQNVFIIENWEPTQAPHKDGFNSFIINLASPTVILLIEDSSALWVLMTTENPVKEQTDHPFTFLSSSSRLINNIRRFFTDLTHQAILELVCPFIWLGGQYNSGQT